MTPGYGHPTGPVAERVGEVPVLMGGGLLGTAAVACGLLPRSTRDLRRLDAVEANPAPGVAVLADRRIGE